jgi:uncharacterized peroxidase-related enzyme
VEVAPILNVSDLNASFAWFAKLGWEKGWEWCPPSSTGATFGAVASDGHEIFLCLDGQGGRGENGAWLSVWLDHPDGVHELHAVCVREGLDVVEPPEDKPWGVREMSIRHPDGHMLRVSAQTPHEHPHDERRTVGPRRHEGGAMSFIALIPDSQASDEVEQHFEAGRVSLGYVPNYARAFGHRPAIYAGWLQLNGAIKASMDLRRYELVTLAAARRLRSSYCALAHGKVIAEQFLDASTVRDVVVDHRSGGLGELDIAVMDLAEKVVDDAGSVTKADIDRLRTLGLSDGEILEVVAAAAARCFFSKTLDALGVQADVAFADLEPELRDALTVGRPIAEP